MRMAMSKDGPDSTGRIIIREARTLTGMSPRPGGGEWPNPLPRVGCEVHVYGPGRGWNGKVVSVDEAEHTYTVEVTHG